MADSLFTKIISGDIPSYKIYEDDKVYAFLDINPVQPGHTLVVPKKQVEFLWDLNDEDYNHLMIIVKKIARHIRDKASKEFVGIKVEGIDVPHAHVHVIPFSNGPEFNKVPDPTNRASEEQLQQMQTLLKIN